jgi:hypothetical protein
MISFDRIKNYYPASMAENSVFQKHILTEYVQLLTLDYLSTTEHIRKMTFIGGTNLRLTKGIDRFSEDLDFDCKNLTEKEFIRMSDDVLTFLRRSGFNVEARAREKSGLKAFRRSLYFPELLFSLGISGHREARFCTENRSPRISRYPMSRSWSSSRVAVCSSHFRFRLKQCCVP